ncbi:MAG: ChbG/HpnK family deacetylase [Candidatus Brocadiae bacterium]|nr:ChbG/HpnK family deacetylase [Candidatus Brocadiia bacterium]
MVSPTRRLIINADDLGADSSRNRGIFEAARRGVVTDASLLVNFPGFDDAVADPRIREFPVGLHLNISEGRPVGGGYRTLTGADGQFHGKEETWRRALAGVLDPAEIHEEASAQLGRMRAAGIEPSHVDGHQHLHLVPRVAAGLVALPVARRVRLVFEHPDGTVVAGPEKAPFLNRLRELSAASRPLWAAAGWIWPAAHLGAGLIGAVHAGSLLRLLDLVPHGTTELLVHPGYPDTSSIPFSSGEREIELEALLDPRLRDGLVSRGIALTSWLQL